MKLSVSAFRAQASAQRKILSSYKNHLNYGACTSLPAFGGYALEENVQMMVDSTAIAPATPTKPHQCPQTQHHSEAPHNEQDTAKMDKQHTPDPVPDTPKRELTMLLDKSPGRTRSKSNQRWMKLRTTVQLSGAISSTNQKPKPPLKREDSFLKRFSTRQIPETQETVDTGDETETHNGSQTQNEVNRRRRRRRKEMSKTVVNPDENFYFYWLMTVTVCVLYNLWTLIVRQSFPELQKAASSFWYSGDGFTDIVFVCDIMVQFRTGYLEQGLMVYNSRKLASHYVKSRAFILDTLSLLPLDFLQFKIGLNPLLRFPRFLKVYRVYNYYYMVESRTVYPNLWRVVNLIHILLILAHWFGCFYYLLSEAEGFQGHWVYPHRPGDYATLTRKYLGSLYWSTLTLTTIGDLPTPETNAESRGRSKAMTSSGQSEGIPRRGHKSRLLQFNSNYGYLFTIISYLIGVFIFATIVGQVGNVITNRNANRLEFERLLDGAKTYMRHHKVPGGMKRRVLRWYDYSWSRGRIQGGGDINTALGLLPDKLKTELALHVNLSVLKKVTIFQECQPEFLHDLVLKMKAYIFTPGDLICRKGEVAREMFIIADGILDVISETGRVLTTMKAGDFFGEIGILNLDGLNKRTADVRSVGYSELFSLSREDVLAAMKDYPEAQEILQSLGRKRLMEAKNASKMHKAQVRQVKEHDSSGDSDTAGKRIVEKLRSDVKGLKKALRRSRRGTRTKASAGRPPQFSGEITYAKKQSILRRMSHVQSSDEFEAAVDADQSPIGAGLPLLQRLKILREKQEKEGEEMENVKSLSVADGSPRQRGESSGLETGGSGLAFRQKLKLLKQKDMKETMVSGFGLVPSTVRTQVTGIQSGRSTVKTTSFRSCRDAEESSDKRRNEEESLTGRMALKERLKLIQQPGQAKEKSLLSRSVQEEGAVGNAASQSPFESHFKTSVNVPTAREADNNVPKLVQSIPEVPVSKDCWKLLKKSSISCPESERMADNKKGKVERKVSKKGTYLSKSDTILERQKTVQRDEEKRSRSISPSNGSPSVDKTAENSSGERRRSSSVGHSPKLEEHKDDIGVREFLDSSTSEKGEIFQGHSDGKNGEKMKKYNSISDLSPEYSGLPFVKKLKILNERQKLEELEKELVVRSLSLDVSEKPKTRSGNVLVRSQSEASTAEYRSGEATDLGAELDTACSPASECHRSKPKQNSKLRNLIGDDKRYENSISRCSEGSIASPESNETLERRHLKSILKKLSAEGSTSDEDKAFKTLQRGSSYSKRDESTELKKLMREPTLEGYAARHKKLTKSVTFDSDTLPSPLDALLEQPPDEPKGKGYSPTSPTAILTLQLSNLSMMPIASPKSSTKPEGQREKEQSGSIDVQTTVAGVAHMREEGHYLSSPPKLESKQKQNLLRPFSVEEFAEKNVAILPFTIKPHDQFFGEIEGEIVEIIRQLLEKAHTKFESQFTSLQGEVKKRDEIIAHLRSKIHYLETKYLKKFQNNGGAEVIGKNTESSATDSDSSDVPLPREGSCETVWDVQSPFDIGVRRAESPEEADNSWKATGNGLVTLSQACDFPVEGDFSDLPFDYLANVVHAKETRNSWEGVCLRQGRSEGGDWAKGGVGKGREATGEEEVELRELAQHLLGGELRRQRNGLAEESYSEAMPKGSEVGRRTGESGCRGNLVNRTSKFQRSISGRREKNAGFIVLDIDESSKSSDVENGDNKDWEVQMLVEELAKKDPYWRMEEREWESYAEGDVEHLEGMEKLREEVNTLKRVVCDSDLSRLTNSELDILESIIEAKDQKILQIAKSSSLDHESKSDAQKKSKLIGLSGTESKFGDREQSKKCSLKHKIGQALSFDFHDMESRKPKVFKSIKHGRSYLKAQRTISGFHREHQSLYSLWRTSARLRNRVLDDSERIIESTTVSGPTTSLPILISTSPTQEKSYNLRTSLPALSAQDYTPSFCQSFTSSAVARSSVRSFEEPHRERHANQTRDPVFQEPDPSARVETPNFNIPSTSATVKSNDGHATNSFNSFIKSVGQKVKQVMVGDVNAVPDQVPTISKLLEDQSSLQGPETRTADGMEGSGEGPTPEDVRTLASESSKVLSSFDRDPKTDPTDL